MNPIDTTILELFQEEVESQSTALVDGLLKLERGANDLGLLSALMRASHSLKGAARLVDMPIAEGVAHSLEECFVAAQNGKIRLDPLNVDVLLKAVDLIGRLAGASSAEREGLSLEADKLVENVRAVHKGQLGAARQVTPAAPAAPLSPAPAAPLSPAPAAPLSKDAELIAHPVAMQALRRAIKNPHPPPGQGAPGLGATAPVGMDADSPSFSLLPLPLPEANTGSLAGLEALGVAGEVNQKRRGLRISATRLDSILGLAGEIDVSVRWLRELGADLERLKQRQFDLQVHVNELREGQSVMSVDVVQQRLAQVDERLRRCSSDLDQRLEGLHGYERRMTQLASDLHEEVLGSRIRPFKDVIRGLPRMTRELARELGKDCRLLVRGEETPVDRDVLEQIEAPLTQIIRNSLDHGLECPDHREARGKPRQGTLTVVAEQRAGMLYIAVQDDGRGVDLDRLRDSIVERGLATRDMVETFSESELLEFLFLPSFSTRREVTTISGRGVGLDVVRDAVRAMRGSVSATTRAGLGMTVELSMPISLAVVRTLLVEIAGEAYAFALSRVVRAEVVCESEITLIQGMPHVNWEHTQLGLVWGVEMLRLGARRPSVGMLNVVVLGSNRRPVGFVVDRFIGQCDLAVRRLDKRLGKVRDVSAAALLDDGTLALILDADDLLTSMDRLAERRRLESRGDNRGHGLQQRRRVLVVEDSLTVRALEKKLLENAGYEVTTAVDGAEGWNALREGQFDLVITDIDMPRMNGFELLQLIRAESRFKRLPVVVVSYKDQDVYRMRGLELGADRYLTKGSFQNQAFVEAVKDLIGAA